MSKRRKAARKAEGRDWKRYTFYLDEDVRASLGRIRERDGMSESEQIRRAVRAWVAEREATPGKE
jgi:hypothetical protein